MNAALAMSSNPTSTIMGGIPFTVQAIATPAANDSPRTPTLESFFILSPFFLHGVLRNHPVDRTRIDRRAVWSANRSLDAEQILVDACSLLFGLRSLCCCQWLVEHQVPAEA